MTRRSYRQYCALARALDVVGERWTLLVVRELCAGPRRYGDLLAGLPGIGTNLLAARLKQLESDEVVTRVPTDDGRSALYELTERGRALEPLLAGLGAWGLELLGDPRDDDRFETSWLPMALRIRFRPDRATGVRETYGYEIDGAAFHVVIEDGEMHAGRGAADDAAFTLAADADSLVELAAGTLDPSDALASGRWQLEGSRAALRRSLRLFPPS